MDREAIIKLGRISRRNEREILTALISTTSSDSKYFVQIGHYQHLRSLRSALVGLEHWTGLAVNAKSDSSPHREWREPTGEEVIALMWQAKVPKEPDLLTIDVNPNAFHILRIVLKSYSPRLVAVRYDPSSGCVSNEVVPYWPFMSWDEPKHSGSSFYAYCQLAKFFQYVPLRCSQNERMVYLVREDISQGNIRATFGATRSQTRSAIPHPHCLNSSHYLLDGVTTVHTRYGQLSYFSNDEFIGPSLAAGEYWQEPLLERIGNLHFQTRGVALDIGAHVGTHAIAIAKLFRSLKILCFEPQEPLFRLLQRNISENNLTDRIIAINAAVGDISGPAHMSRVASDGVSAGLDVEYGSDRIVNLGGIQLSLSGSVCQMISIDDLKLENVVYVKIDVEGAEALVLEGMSRTIREDKPTIVCEYRADRSLELSQTVPLRSYSPRDTRDVLVTAGYHVESHGGDLIGLPLPISTAFENDQPQIPRRIFQTWKTKHSLPSNFLTWRATFPALNSNFEYELWDDDDNRNFIMSEFSWFLPLYDSFPSEIFRVDAVRYFYLYIHGGLYVDLDTECLKPLDTLLLKSDVVLGRMGDNSDFQHSIPNAIMASHPRQEFWLYVIACLIRASYRHARPEFVTGPVLLKNAVDQYLAVRSVWKDLDMAAVATKLRNDQLPNPRRSSIEIMKSQALYPLDWSNPLHQILRAKILTGEPIDAGQRSVLFEESYMVTYWAHTWE